MTRQQAPEVTSEPDLSWIDIGVCRNATVIADYSPGWGEFFGSTDFHVEDCIDTGASMPTEVGLYRWSGYHIRYWDEGDLAKLDGGTFARATQPLSLTVDEIRDVVEPFAKMGGMLDGPFAPALFKDEDAIGMGAWSENGEPRTITFGDLRRAKAALDRLQSLSLPVDIDRSGLAQEVK